MIVALNNQLSFANCRLDKYGKDQTGTIEYIFNSGGFRSDVEFNFIPEIAFFGGSTFFGVGVPAYNIIPTIIANYKNLKFWNCSYAYVEYNNEMIFNTILNTSKIVNNIPIVVQWVGNDYQPRASEKVEYYITQTKKIYNNSFHCIIDGNFNKESIDQTIVSLVNPIWKDTDLDGRHPGVQTHQGLSSFIIKKIF